MKYLSRVLKEEVKDRIRNSDVRERCGYKKNLLKQLDQSILKWFEHMERMGGGWPERERKRGRLKLRWIE